MTEPENGRRVGKLVESGRDYPRNGQRVSCGEIWGNLLAHHERRAHFFPMLVARYHDDTLLLGCTQMDRDAHLSWGEMEKTREEMQQL